MDMKMNKMLLDSYAYQIKAIGALEGLNREACFKDPSIDKGIEMMYGIGKPATEQAAGLAQQRDFAGALERLAAAKLAHHRYMILLY